MRKDFGVGVSDTRLKEALRVALERLNGFNLRDRRVLFRNSGIEDSFELFTISRCSEYIHGAVMPSINTPFLVTVALEHPHSSKLCHFALVTD